MRGMVDLAAIALCVAAIAAVLLESSRARRRRDDLERDGLLRSAAAARGARYQCCGELIHEGHADACPAVVPWR